MQKETLELKNNQNKPEWAQQQNVVDRKKSSKLESRRNRNCPV